MIENQAVTKEQEQKVIKALRNASDDEAIAMLNSLKAYATPFYIKVLLEMLTEARPESLKRAITEFIANIRLQEVVIHIADFVAKNHKDLDVSHIVTASWQNSLDFSRHLAPYFDVLIFADYQLAFEAFTVIENSIHSLERNEISQFEALLTNALPHATDAKQRLIEAMLDQLKQVD